MGYPDDPDFPDHPDNLDYLDNPDFPENLENLDFPDTLENQYLCCPELKGHRIDGSRNGDHHGS